MLNPRQRAAREGRLGVHAPDARTLYLAAAQPLRVTSTGEALVVGQADGRIVRVPVTRVLRVVCAAEAEWSGAALALCMERGIAVCWLDARGEALGHLWPRQAPGAELASALDLLAAELPQWPASYADWLRRRRFALLRGWRAQRAEAGHAVGEKEWECAKRHYAYRGEIPQHLPPRLRGMAAALVAQRLCEQGLQPHYWCADGTVLALAEDLTDLLWAEMNLCGGALAAAVERPAESAALFEHWSGTHAGAIHAHLANLRGHALRELAL